MLTLTRTQARRVAVRAQLLDQPRPEDLFEVVRRLALVKIDPTSAVAPSADLVLWSRLGAAYQPRDLAAALDEQSLVELRGVIRPREDIALYTAEMAQWPGRGELVYWLEAQAEWVQANDGCRRDILDRLTDLGPLTSRELPDSCDVPWRSSGWTNNRNVTQLLELMVRRGEVAVSGRAGRERLWDLAERVYPEVPPVPQAEALRIRAERRLRSLGIARDRGPEAAVEPVHVGEVGVAATVEGVAGPWRVDADQVDQLDQRFDGRVALLSPFDRLVDDRRRMTELFAFDYLLEMYKPAAKRRWGYYALPILAGDRLLGKLDVTADHRAGVLRLNAIHRDGRWSAAIEAAVQDEVEALAAWLELELAEAG